MEVNGLPLHVLVIHAAVVIGPVAALLASLYVLVPRWRDTLRWPMAGLAVATAVIAWVAVLSGEDFRESARFATAQGAFAEQLHEHEEYGEMLRNIATGFGLLGLLAAWVHTRTGPVRVLVGVLLLLAALGTGVWTFLAGEAGARATWAPAS